MADRKQDDGKPEGILDLDDMQAESRDTGAAEAEMVEGGTSGRPGPLRKVFANRPIGRR